MLGMISNFNSDKHTIIGGEIGLYIKRLSETSKRDFAVIRYNNLGVFCIVEYLSPNRDVFIDILNLGQSLSNFTREKAYELRNRIFAPITTERTSREIAEAESQYHHEMQDWNEEEGERLAKCAKGE